MNEISDRILTLRNALKLSQTEFSTPLGITKTAVSGWESGRREPSEPMVLSICRLWNVSYIWLRDGVGDMFINVPETTLDELTLEYDLDDFERKLVEKFIKLNKHEREAITKYMKSVFDLK